VIIIIKMIIKFYNIYYNIGSYTGRNWGRRKLYAEDGT
jgi:hypothetical protein